MVSKAVSTLDQKRIGIGSHLDGQVSTLHLFVEQTCPLMSHGWRRAVEEIRTSNAKQSLSCDKLVGHMHTMLPGLLRA